jgi:hypothetical protein
MNTITNKNFKIMKTRITTLLTALMLISIVTFANDDIKPSEQLKKEFSNEFAQASDVKWEKVADYYKASFVQDGQYFVAYFNTSNKLEYISRSINTTMLPLLLQKDLKNKVSESSWITDCFELSVEYGTEYFVVIESDDQKTIYQADEFAWSVYKRTDK